MLLFVLLFRVPPAFIPLIEAAEALKEATIIFFAAYTGAARKILPQM